MTAGTKDGENERLDELLVSDWGNDLSPDERPELQAQLGSHPDHAHALERAAAAACVAFALADPTLPRPPAQLLDKVREGARAHVGGDRGPRLVPPPIDDLLVDPPSRAAPGSDRPKRGRPGVGWWLALAASVALAVAGWLPRLGPEPIPPEPVVVEVPVPVPPPEPPPPAARLAQLEAAPDARAVAWSTTEDPWVDEVRGQVVWSTERQEGYMTFAGLPENDPTEHRYQLWIFDSTRDERYPVDGGIFDIAEAEDEVVVPISAKLPVRDPQLFAVTLEGPDGVVVSSREHVLVVAQLDR